MNWQASLDANVVRRSVAQVDDVQYLWILDAWG